MSSAPSFARSFVLAGLLALPFAAPGTAEPTARKSVWDLRVGEPIAAQPDVAEFVAYACGANGGPPRQKLSGFGDFMGCPPDAAGLREVYFEYDDELEYVARARDDEQLLGKFAGTAERGFPLVVSALFDSAGILAGVRLVTDARSDYRRDATDADLSGRAEAYKFGALMAARFDIDPASDCVKSPPADGESGVGGVFVKLDCERTDAAAKRRYLLSVRYLRKPGQSGRDPRAPQQLTKGQFESSARLEILALP